MEALRLADGRAQLDAGRCIGCGLCVSTCPTEALVLERKRERPDVPANIQGAMLRLGKARGKFSAPSLAWIVLKSKLDRLLANG
jgi:ferredoxin